MGEPAIVVLSLGAGVQSTVLALKGERGEFGRKPDCAIFSDTGWEPRKIYAHLDWIQSQVSYPVIQVSAGNLREDCLRNARGEQQTGKRSTLPAFAIGDDLRASPIMRQCTRDYKVDPINRKIRELLGAGKGERVPSGVFAEQWIGISTDEMIRMKDSRVKWAKMRWPLIEAGMSRNDCLRWFAKNYPGRELAKSSCIGCPYHSNAMWRDMKDNDPESWADAVEFDAAIRSGFAGSRGELYLHRSLVPLRDVDLSTPAERGQIEFGFLQECDGMCGN